MLNNTSHHLLVRCKESLSLFNNIPLQTAHVSDGDISGSVHRVSEQPHKCRNDTGGPDTNSREQQFRDKVIASLHVASGAGQSVVLRSPFGKMPRHQAPRLLLLEEGTSLIVSYKDILGRLFPVLTCQVLTVRMLFSSELM